MRYGGRCWGHGGSILTTRLEIHVVVIVISVVHHVVMVVWWRWWWRVLVVMVVVIWVPWEGGHGAEGA